MWVGLALSYHLASRLAYVVGIGVALTRQQHRQAFTRRDGTERGFRRFRRLAAALMNNDAASFVLLCIVSRQTLPFTLPLAVQVGGGLLLVAVGLSVKLWAARGLGPAAYYWGDFFGVQEPVIRTEPGPYRFLKNPMYTVGYLHAYGAALFAASLPGVIAALFDQVAILIFNRLVETPHFERLTRTERHAER
jgi:protein-S-isoprenylcysteine O-methyltransferase Ste14